MSIKVAIGTLIYREGAYVVDKFLSNQKQIKQNYPSSELILATAENDYVEELNRLVKSWKLKATVIYYEVVKPDYAHSRIWNITCGREAIRSYMLSQTRADYLLFLDADSTYEPSVITTMEEEIKGYDVVFSGYPLRSYGIGLAGCGCLMIARDVLEKFEFRCHEFRNGDVIFEDNVLEVDLFHLRRSVKKGFFVTIDHYMDEDAFRHIDPQPVGILRRVANCALLRYLIIRMSIMVHCNIPWRGKVLYNKFIYRIRAR